MSGRCSLTAILAEENINPLDERWEQPPQLLSLIVKKWPMLDFRGKAKYFGGL